MIYYKTKEEIELIRESGLILGKAHAEVAKFVIPGVSLMKLDKIAEEFIKDNNAKPSFKGYNGFPGSLCISLNDQVVHGIPSDIELKSGDIVSIDCGVYLNSFHSDSAYSYGVGEITVEDQKLLNITKLSLYKGIEQAKNGQRIGDISFAIQDCVEKEGFTVVRELVGHGLGRNLHESPEVPNYGRRGRGPKLKEGLVIAIEPMINLGKKEVRQENDGWTIATIDGKNSVHFEHTIAITSDGADILTTFEFIEEVLQQRVNG